MGDLVQVTFHFDGATEIRYLNEPNVGDEVHATDGSTWRVVDVVEENGRFLVECVLDEPRRGYGRAA